ncbi:MAG: hypothetical protein R3F62_31345 [Planctomycetota bacterium]
MAGFACAVDGLCYALDELPSPAASKTVLTVTLAAPGGEGAAPDAEAAPLAPADPGSRLVDRVDLFSFRSRLRFAQLVAAQFGRDPDAVLGQLALVLDKAERARAQTDTPDPVELTPERKRRALYLLRRKDLLARAADAMDALGFVGEPATKRLAYLVVTSRLLDRPLSALLFAPTSSGKSELLEVLTKLLPAESVEYLSRLTPQALFYAGPNALRHKVVMVDEHVGAKEADYSLRTLLSRGSLTLRASPKPGGVSRPFTVYGPISLLSGTTSSAINEENLTRCLELSLDDGSEQTRLVQEAQRARWAGEARPEVELERWQDAQRLLESLEVVIPFAHALRFPARTSHDRRGNQKLLGLIAAHALLHQRQREHDEHGRLVATPADYAAVYQLVRAAVRVDLECLSPKAASAYRLLAEAGRPLSRRGLAGESGWSYNTAKKALGELVGQELARKLGAGSPARYALVDRSLLGGSSELLDPAELGVPAEAAAPTPAKSASQEVA